MILRHFWNLRYVHWTIFDDFKGLDRNCVMVLGLDDHLSNKQEDDDALKKMLYVSMTRANFRLYISTTPLLAEKISEFVEEYLQLNI